MTPPRKAFVLAAGLGTRLMPHTREVPKPMLPFWGRPMLDHVLGLLSAWGVRDVLLNLHHAPGPIMRYLASQPFPSLRVTATFEPEILGTGGALRHAAWFLDQPFWLLNADVVAHVDPRPLIQAWQTYRPLAACWLTEEAGPRTVRCHGGQICNFHDPKQGRFTFCGVQLLDSRILNFIAPAGFDTIIAAYQRAQRQGHRLLGIPVPGAFWADIGTPSQYIQAHRDTATGLGQVGQSFRVPATLALSDRERRCLSRPPLGLSMEALCAEILPVRGSQREFIRLCLPQGPLMCIRWSPERSENRLYAGHLTFLEHLGVAVPRLLLNAPRERLLVLEDLGEDTLESRLAGWRESRIRCVYEHVLDMTLLLHTKGLAAARHRRLRLMPGFGPTLYTWEHRYFVQHVLQDLLGWRENQTAAVLGELASAAQVLAASPQALIHRDWQSSNVLFRGNQPVMIDFQGMRRGPAAYDLASLLADPYARLSPQLQHKLLHGYARCHPEGQAIAAAFPAAVVQRLAQAMGAYAVLSRKPGMESFARHIPVAAAGLLRALEAFPAPGLHKAALAVLRHAAPEG